MKGFWGTITQAVITLKDPKSLRGYDYAFVNFYNDSIESLAMIDIMEHVEQAYTQDLRKVAFVQIKDKFQDCPVPCLALFAFIEDETLVKYPVFTYDPSVQLTIQAARYLQTVELLIQPWIQEITCNQIKQTPAVVYFGSDPQWLKKVALYQRFTYRDPLYFYFASQDCSVNKLELHLVSEANIPLLTTDFGFDQFNRWLTLSLVQFGNRWSDRVSDAIQRYNSHLIVYFTEEESMYQTLFAATKKLANEMQIATLITKLVDPSVDEQLSTQLGASEEGLYLVFRQGLEVVKYPYQLGCAELLVGWVTYWVTLIEFQIVRGQLSVDEQNEVFTQIQKGRQEVERLARKDDL